MRVWIKDGLKAFVISALVIFIMGSFGLLLKVPFGGTFYNTTDSIIGAFVAIMMLAIPIGTIVAIYSYFKNRK